MLVSLPAMLRASSPGVVNLSFSAIKGVANFDSLTYYEVKLIPNFSVAVEKS